MDAALPVYKELPFIGNPISASKAIASAWEAFVSVGRFVRGSPRPVIADSWERCRQLGISPQIRRARTQISPEEVESILAEETVCRAAREVLQRYAPLVEGSGHVIVFADAKGRILCSVGSNETRSKLEEINFMPGAVWDEAAVGPNGVGTPIALGRPELVFGSEHYCEGWHPWVCYGSPVYDTESGELAGVIDITGPAHCAQVETLALTVALAQCMEHKLQHMQLQHREALRDQFRDLERRWPEDGLLLIDAHGRLVDGNHVALNHLGRELKSILNHRLEEVEPRLWEAVGAGGTKEVIIDPAASACANSGTRAFRLEPIMQGNRKLGTAVVITPNRLAASVASRRALPARKAFRVAAYTFSDLVGESSQYKEAVALARAAARDPSENPVLLTGESGTGKELLAHAIHAASRRANGPIVVLNCGALPATLAESELFGYAPGAFTGAQRNGHAGKFESANGGTLFIDEVDSLPIDLQAKFLRALEEGCITRLGSATPVSINVRVIAAGGAQLRERLNTGGFRTDLFHRLAVIEIDVPPLRARQGDLERLLKHFLEKSCRDAGRRTLTVAPAVMSHLHAYAWPGNVRELRNLCSRWALIVTHDSITLDDLPTHMRAPTVLNSLQGTDTPLQEMEDALIRKVLAESDGCISRAAARLGLNRTTIYRRMKRWERK